MSRDTAKSSRSPFAFATGLWKNRELLWQFSLREVELRHKGSHLGLIWSLLNPLLMLSLYVFVFGYIFGGRFGVLPNVLCCPLRGLHFRSAFEARQTLRGFDSEELAL